MAEVDDHDFEILLSCPHGLTSEQVMVDFAARFDRQPHPENSTEAQIETVWQDMRQHNPSLYNGTKFRYAGFRVLESEPLPGPSPSPVVSGPNKQADSEPIAPVEETARPSKVCLQLGLCDYRTFAGTNLCKDWESLLAPSGTPGMGRYQHLADPLGNAAVVVTGDKMALLLHRGQSVGEFPDCPVFPGGHSEPVEVGIMGHRGSMYPEERQQLNNMISMEMFAGIVREVHEETGAPMDDISDVRFLGLVRRRRNARPVAMFACQCRLTAVQVQAAYTNAEHKFESTQLRAVPLEELHKESQAMPGCHKGGAALALAFLKQQGLLK